MNWGDPCLGSLIVRLCVKPESRRGTSSIWDSHHPLLPSHRAADSRDLLTGAAPRNSRAAWLALDLGTSRRPQPPGLLSAVIRAISIVAAYHPPWVGGGGRSGLVALTCLMPDLRFETLLGPPQETGRNSCWDMGGRRRRPSVWQTPKDLRLFFPMRDLPPQGRIFRYKVIRRTSL